MNSEDLQHLLNNINTKNRQNKTQKSPRPLVNAPNGYLNDGSKYLRLKKLLRLKTLVLKLLEYSDAI